MIVKKRNESNKWNTRCVCLEYGRIYMWPSYYVYTYPISSAHKNTRSNSHYILGIHKQNASNAVNVCCSTSIHIGMFRSVTASCCWSFDWLRCLEALHFIEKLTELMAKRNVGKTHLPHSLVIVSVFEPFIHSRSNYDTKVAKKIKTERPEPEEKMI